MTVTSCTIHRTNSGNHPCLLAFQRALLSYHVSAIDQKRYHFPRDQTETPDLHIYTHHNDTSTSSAQLQPQHPLEMVSHPPRALRWPIGGQTIPTPRGSPAHLTLENLHDCLDKLIGYFAAGRPGIKRSGCRQHSPNSCSGKVRLRKDSPEHGP